MRYYYLDANKQVVGPLDSDPLFELWKERKIFPHTMVVPEGEDRWVEFSVLFSSRPGAVRVFGILNIVFGSFGILFSPFVILGLFSGISRFPEVGDAYSIWVKTSGLIGIAGSILMLISGIGLCRFREWGRRIAVGYAWYCVAAGAAGLVINILVLLPRFSGMRSCCSAGTVGGIIGMIFGGGISLIYPILLIIFLMRERVKAALRNPAPSLDQITSSGRSGFEAYQTVAETVGLIPSLRLKDNLYQAAVLIIGGLLGLGLGTLLGGSGWTMPGLLIGLAVFLFLSGFVLLILGFVRLGSKKGR